ncbi:MAG: succinyldiaminopimelate transaminase [Gammaproteobacteria bacterium]|nr:succinyldiaminopimelate transaminase [Gammaproteobacteria bacterium]
MNPDLSKLQPYPFEKLAALKAECRPPQDLPHIALSIGEPKHPAPEVALQPLRENLDAINNYPLTKGVPELRQAIANWLQTRFSLPTGAVNVDDQIIPVNGTREALFAFAQAVVERSDDALVLMPNPFYQIYEGAAYLAGATPYFYATTRDNNYQPDFDAIPEDIWQRCQLIYVCTPGNPTGAVISEAVLVKLIEKSKQYDFIIASDECYSEIYFDGVKPAGLLQAAVNSGNGDFKNCVVFHSLSKRSNLPGMRSGFVAGDAGVMKAFLLFRTYHGCAMPPVHQLASIAAWSDEAHVEQNRQLYQDKFDTVLAILAPVCEAQKPDAGFYLWLHTDIDDADFAQQLFHQQNVTVLPGSYLSRDVDGQNPGNHHVRMALVAPFDECIEAANRIKQFIETL